MSFILQHTVLYWCSLDILVAILLIGFTVYFVLKHRQFKLQEKELKNAIDELSESNFKE